MYIENLNSIKPQPLPKKGGLFGIKTKLTKEKRKMSYYKHTFITNQDLSESQSKKILEKYENIISKNSGKILKVEEWGLRTLSHQIKNNKKGFYFHIKFEGIGKTIEELERAEKIDEKLIRFLSIKVKKHDLETNYFEKKDFQKNIKNEKDEKKK